MKEGAILDLGCGLKKAEGAVGVDRDPLRHPDVLHDLNVVPWPLPDDGFDRILCRHILEHLRDVDQTVQEIHRVARPGAHVVIVTPHFSSVNSWDDPTHLHHFSSAAFDRYCQPLDGDGVAQGPGAAPFQMIAKDLKFGRSFLNLVPRAISRRSLRWYEKHLAFIFPARNLTIVLGARKR
ncbi:MAG: methyltransferase domain-containing protein [Planctomycetota bacterium]|nr:methyltransferase domain-containing protein [Planctomycetota bacterium]